MVQTTVKNHWDKVHTSKKIEEFSWYQKSPTTSLDFIFNMHIPRDSRIIDIGGGDSYLVDHLLSEGFSDITVLDISKEALKKVKTRLGYTSNKVKYIHSNIVEFVPDRKYDLWHDRAALHFLTEPEELSKYQDLVNQAVAPKGHIILGTFAKDGPDYCSGLKVQKYDKGDMKGLFSSNFQLLRCKKIDHFTPLHKIQKFTFCCFQRVD